MTEKEIKEYKNQLRKEINKEIAERVVLKLINVSLNLKDFIEKTKKEFNLKEFKVEIISLKLEE